MMESTNSINDQQTPPTIPINNSSSRRKQSKPNRLEHAGNENSSNVILTSDPITPYHVAAEQQDLINHDDDYDRISLNCEDGSLSSQSTNEILNEQQIQNHETMNPVLDFSFKIDQTNQQNFNRSRSLNPSNKSRSLKRKHLNGNNEQQRTLNLQNKIFHADAFCGICRKEFCNKYFLKTHLANKHGIFDHQSVVPSVTSPTLPSLLQSPKNSTDTTNDSHISHPFTVISTLINNDHDEISSPTTSDINQNTDEQNENELTSLEDQMNGVIAGDDDNHNHDNSIEDNTTTNNNNEDDDEQDGTSSHHLINLPEQLGSLLSNDNIKTDDDQRVITTNSPTNNPDFQSTTNLSRQSSNKLFEDFCDICQKHFCNKYYLRKHKLDVHGVQTDGNIKSYKRIDNNVLSSKNSPPSAIQLPSSFSNVAFNPSTVQQSLGLLLNPIFSPLVQSSTSNEQQNFGTNKRRYTDSSNESSSSKSQYLTSDVNNIFSNQMNNSKSQISTCHLCGKKFQSNDYLQLHLMNKHQIKTDLQRTNKMSNLIKTSNENNTIKKIKLEPNETTTITTTNLIKPSSPINLITSPNPNATIGSGIVDTYFAAKMADRVSCDICHKQVCNKYFLKTHKLKVHGVGSDPLVPPSTTNESMEEENERDESDDRSPSRLVVDEITTETSGIPSPDVLTASVNTFLGTSNESSNEQLSSITCDLCSKTFPSKFLLHIHMTNVHGIQQTNSGSNGIPSSSTTTIILNNNDTKLLNPTNKRAISNGSSPVRLKQTPQVQLRVTCQVCKKELCNKYFLRAHMRNVHNISVDDIRLNPSDNDKQPSSKQIFSLSSNILSPTDIKSTNLNDNNNNNNNSNGHMNDSNQSSPSSSSNDNNNNSPNLLSMQPFLVESDDDLYKDLFVPCMVYLPCRHRVTKPLEISLRLKPVDNSSSPPSNTNTTTNID